MTGLKHRGDLSEVNMCLIKNNKNCLLTLSFNLYFTKKMNLDPFFVRV